MNRRVLLIEDDDGARAVLAAALARHGFHVRTAGSPGEALACAGQGPFDAVVTDIVLDDGADAGLELIPALRERGVLAPVVVVSAFADKQRLKRAIELRVAYLLEKPFTLEQLLAVLERVWTEPSELGQYVERALRQANLTPKEEEVARLALKGLSNEEIARVLRNSDKTVRQHLSSVYAKCRVTSRAELFHHVFPT